MMKLLLTYILFFSLLHLSAQSIDKTIVASAGGNTAVSEVNIGFTIGEPIIGFISSDNSIDQGFWAGSLTVEAISAETELEGIEIYPNPVEDELNIFTNNNPVYAITLFAMDGRRTLKKQVDTTIIEHTINLSHLSKGMYVLRLFIEGTDEAKLFKIIKK